jgi:type II secretory pathway pseudopilin PulG
VIAIITILITMLMAAVVSAQRQAEAVQCASNLKQIGDALKMYEGANQGMLPAWSGWHSWPAGANQEGGAWTVELMPYIGDPDSRVYNCPSFRSKVRRRNYFLAAQWAGKSGRRSMKLSEVTMTGRFVLSGDKTQRGLYPPPFGTNSVNEDDADPDDYGGPSENPVLAWPWDPGGFYMHRGGNNVLFDDMHVALFSRYDPYNMTFNPHRMQDWFDVTGDPAPRSAN